MLAAFKWEGEGLQRNVGRRGQKSCTITRIKGGKPVVHRHNFMLGGLYWPMIDTKGDHSTKSGQSPPYISLSFSQKWVEAKFIYIPNPWWCSCFIHMTIPNFIGFHLSFLLVKVQTSPCPSRHSVLHRPYYLWHVLWGKTCLWIF